MYKTTNKELYLQTTKWVLKRSNHRRQDQVVAAYKQILTPAQNDRVRWHNEAHVKQQSANHTVGKAVDTNTKFPKQRSSKWLRAWGQQGPSTPIQNLEQGQVMASSEVHDNQQPGQGGGAGRCCWCAPMTWVTNWQNQPVTCLSVRTTKLIHSRGGQRHCGARARSSATCTQYMKSHRAD